MPYCQSCGNEVTQGIQVCSNCGSILNKLPNQPIAPMTTYPPPTITSINKKIVAIIIVVVIAIATVGMILLLTQDDGDQDEGNNGSPDVEISISTDKTTYNIQENANVTITVNNKMNRDFPYGDYNFDFFMVDKEDYDSMYYSYSIGSENYEARLTIETLSVLGGDLESVTISWVLDTGNYQGPGQYYFIFKIEKDVGDNRSIAIESEEALITIIE